MFAFDNGFERGDCVLQGDEFSLEPGKNFSDGKRLRHESLEFSGSFDGEFIGFGQFVHTENGNDILERLVILEHLLHGGGDLVVFTKLAAVKKGLYSPKTLGSRSRDLESRGSTAG